jgi:hypothetical protein
MTEDECLNGRPDMGLPSRTRTGRMPVPLPTRDFGEVGPKEGERFPDVPLPDPIGRMVDLREARAEWQAIVVSTGARNGKLSSFPPEREMVTVLQMPGFERSQPPRLGRPQPPA